MTRRAQNNDQLYCWEQVLRVNPTFRVSQVFAAKDQARRLLPLYALFCALEELATHAADAEVVGRKLDWWRVECLQTTPEASRHPILKALVAEGAKLDRRQLEQLLESTGFRLDGTAPREPSELEQLVLSSGRPRCALELELTGATVPEEAIDRVALRTGLAQLLRESTGSGRSNRFWWMPLDLLARHAIGRADLEQSVDSDSARAVFADILSYFGKRWGGAGEAPESMIVDFAARHFAVHDYLQARALQRLQQARPSEFGNCLRKVGPATSFQAWKAARRLSRP